MDVTNRDPVSLISVILLLIIRQSPIHVNITVQQGFFCEKTPKKALSTTPPSVCRHFIYIYELVAHLIAGQDELEYFHDHRIGFSNF